MSVTVQSTTDTAEAVADAIGLAAPKVDEKQSASPAQPEEKAEQSDEIPEASDTPDEVETPEEDDGDEDDEQPEAKRPKKKGGFKRRIDKLNGRLSAVEQEKEYWRQQALKTQTPDPAQRTSVAASASDERPKQDAFDTHEEWVEALTDWKVEQKDKAREAKAKETQAKSEFDSQIEEHRARAKAFAKTHEDFDDVIDSVGDIPMSMTVQHVILQSDAGPALMYELAKDPENYERICALPAIAAARELGKIEAKLVEAQPSKTPEAKTTKAPKPLTPVSAKSSAASMKSPDEMSYQEFKKWREANPHA